MQPSKSQAGKLMQVPSAGKNLNNYVSDKAERGVKVSGFVEELLPESTGKNSPRPPSRSR